MDLSSATERDLELLPRIGPALAERIVRWRTERDEIGSLDELLEVRGIGQRTLERLRPHLTLGDHAGNGANGGETGTGD